MAEFLGLVTRPEYETERENRLKTGEFSVGDDVIARLKAFNMGQEVYAVDLSMRVIEVLRNTDYLRLNVSLVDPDNGRIINKEQALNLDTNSIVVNDGEGRSTIVKATGTKLELSLGEELGYLLASITLDPSLVNLHELVAA